MAGCVIGIHHSNVPHPTEDGSLDIPVDVARQAWERLLRGDSWGKQFFTDQGFLLMELSNEPVTVVKTLSGSNAEKAGLKPGDVIVRCEGQAIRTLNDMSPLLLNKIAGDLMTFDIRRGGKLHTVRMQMQEALIN